MESTIKLFQSVRAEALDLGVKIALENHAGDMQAREVKTIIEESGREFVGSNLDTGNPIWVVEDPFVTLETLAPYVVTSHMRDSAVFETANGAAGAMGGHGRWQYRLREVRGRVPQALPPFGDAPGNHHRTPAHAPAVPGGRLLEALSEDARPGSSRASWRWPRAAIPSWAPW